MAPKKKLQVTFKLELSAGQATPAPPVGPALGQHGVNIMEFCKRTTPRPKANVERSSPLRSACTKTVPSPSS